MNFLINGRSFDVDIDARSSLLDLLREHLHLSGTKKAVIKARAEHVPSWSMARGSIRASRLPFNIKTSQSQRLKPSERYLHCTRFRWLLSNMTASNAATALRVKYARRSECRMRSTVVFQAP